VCDPHLNHVDDYPALASAAGGSIGHIFETHVQADHISGAQTLAERTGARVYAHEAAELTFPHVDLRDGQRIELGNDEVRVLHTPGHSYDSVCLLVADRTRSEKPWFVLTGDTLLVGDAGRPDLHDEKDRGDIVTAASALFDSLQQLLALDDAVEVYPAHFAGSACARSMSAKPSSTIGFERRCNDALRPRSREEFITFMLTDLPPAPLQFAEIRRINQGIALPVDRQ
jgi:glyoxylase-like metal-dependent hydrolase (beta-lactamase superfamily II)